MNLLARILSHGFAVVLVLLLGASFIYRGELFPDMPMPEFLGLEKRGAAEPEAAATPDTAGTDAGAGSTTTTAAPADAVTPAQTAVDTGGTETPMVPADRADTAAPAAEELTPTDAPEAVTEPATATPATPLPDTPIPPAETGVQAPDTAVIEEEPGPDATVTETAAAPAPADDVQDIAETAADTDAPAGVTAPSGEAPAAEPSAQEPVVEPQPAEEAAAPEPVVEPQPPAEPDAEEPAEASVTTVPGMTAEPAPPATETVAADEVAPAIEVPPPAEMRTEPAPAAGIEAEPESESITSTPAADSGETVPAGEGQPDTVSIPAPGTVAETPSMVAVAEPDVAPTLDMTRPYHVLAAAREAYWMHDHEKAESLYRRLIDLEPENPDGYGELGNLYFSQGKWDDAASAYFEAGSRLARTGHMMEAQNLLEVVRGLNGSQADELAAIINESR